MKHFRDILVSWGPLGLLLWSAMESAGIPNPGGTDFMLLALAIALPSQAFLCALAAVVGSLAGSVVFYEITRRGGEKLLARYTSSGRGARFRGWFQRYGLSTVFVSALLPVPIMPFVFGRVPGRKLHHLGPRSRVAHGRARDVAPGGNLFPAAISRPAARVRIET
jgi:membrane protein DedA with SNARE-associated domain